MREGRRGRQWRGRKDGDPRITKFDGNKREEELTIKRNEKIDGNKQKE